MEQTRLTPWEPVAAVTMERIKMAELDNVLGVVRGIYTGYTNYVTWAVSVWLGCGEGTHAYWWEAARQARREATRCPQVREELRTEEDAVRSRLADRMMREVCDGAPIGEPGLYSDLLRLALAEVEWLEVADEFLALPESPG